MISEQFLALIIVMCIGCDTWQSDQYTYNGYGFCSSSCLNDYKEREKKRNQKEVEDIDKQIASLQNRKEYLLKGLVGGEKYPWQKYYTTE
jgi:hypothetical protein